MQLLTQGASDFNIHLDDQTLKRFSVYAQHLVVWNQKVNLTAITDPFEIAVKHFLDSIIPSRYITPGESILDIGSGAGFPGIPIAIHSPSSSVTLIDTSRKKVSFLKHIVRMLHLPNVSIYQIDANDFADNRQFDTPFDTVISRALFPLDKTVVTALPLLSESAKVIAMKGKIQNIDMEMERVKGVLEEWKWKKPERNYTMSIDTYTLTPSGDARSIFLFRLNTK